jgi:uncharacterized protein YegJ (DUF2314 family)
MRTALLAILFFACAGASAQKILERAAKDELVFMNDEEPAMKKAFERASQTLDDFFVKANQSLPAHTGFALKVAISEGRRTEYFWVSSFIRKVDGSFEGEIDNEPRIVKHVKAGQRYAFPRNRIVDWTYIDRGERRMVGNFTLCALLTKEPQQEAEATKKRFKLDCSWLQ